VRGAVTSNNATDSSESANANLKHVVEEDLITYGDEGFILADFTYLRVLIIVDAK
jgi:hypothetical protein